MKYKKIAIGLISVFALSFTYSLFAADVNEEIWYNRIGGDLTQINDGEVHTYANQIVRRTGDNLVMTCHEDCENNVQTDFIGLVTVIADCNGKANGEEIKIDLTVNGVSGNARVVCQENPVFDGDGEGAMKCFSKGISYTGEEDNSDINFPGGWTNQNVDCSYKITDPDKLESWNSTIQKLKSGNFDTFAPVNKSGRSVTPVIEIFTHKKNQNQEYKIEGAAKDTLGNESIMSFNDYKIKIDKKPPITPPTNPPTNPPTVSSGVIKIKPINNEGQGFVTLPKGGTTQLEAHESFLLTFSVYDSESGIDWNGSSISVRKPDGSVLSGSFTSGISGLVMNVSQKSVLITNGSDILEKAGNYKIDFDFKDKAGNSASTVTRRIKIVPSEIVGTAGGSILIEDSTTLGQKKLANNSDSRKLNLSLKDRFGNSIMGRRVVVTIPEQDATAGAVTYDLTEGSIGLQKGLRFTGMNKVRQTYSSFSNTESFGLTSYVPSLEVIRSVNVPGATIMKKSISGGGQNINFDVTGQKINPLGIKAGNQPPVTFSTPVVFNPMIYGYLIDRQPEDTDGAGNTIYPSYPTMMDRLHPSATEMLLQYAFGDKFEFFVYANSTGTSPGYFPFLPVDYEVEIFVHAENGINFEEEDYEGGKEVESRGVSGAYNFEETKTHAIREGSIIASPVFALTSKVKVQLGQKTIIYPGGNLGNKVGNKSLFDATELCPDPTDYVNCTDWFSGREVEVIAIEADIEGGILEMKQNSTSFIKDSSIMGGDSKIIKMGGISAKDIREDITQNAYQLIRGRESETVTDLRNRIIDFNTKSVYYVKGTQVNLGNTTFRGTGTLIVEDANIVISEDIYYGDAVKDSLGVILINSTVNNVNFPEGPTNGNIYIRPNVQTIVGTYFADGSIMSIKSVGLNSTFSIDDRNRFLKKQLLINGTIFTKNTLGGVRAQIGDISNNITPWGMAPNTSAGIKMAAKYDLHWLRRYRPNSGASYKNLKTDSNEHATVIRPDGKVQNLTPPGFRIGTLINR